jgi:hypothetical protein
LPRRGRLSHARYATISERGRHRRERKPKALVSAVTPTPTREPLTLVDRTRIARWVASRIVTWASDSCFHCRRPIVYGAKWVELLNDSDRARFHFDCARAWRAQQEAAARKAMGLNQKETSP